MPARGINQGNPPAGGVDEPVFNYGDGVTQLRLIRESVTGATDASKNLAKQIPAGARVIWAGLKFITAITLVTGTRIGLGIAAVDPDRFCLSGTSMVINTTQGPEWHRTPGMWFANPVVSDAISNSTSTGTFAFAGLTVPAFPANFFRPGDVVRIRVRVNTPSTNSSDTLTTTVKLGTATIATLAPVDQVNDDTGIVDCIAIIRTIGASGTVAGGSLQSVDVDAAGDPIVGTIMGSTALDTTAAMSVTVNGTWSAASASDSAVCELLTIEVMRPSAAQVLSPSAATTVTVSPVNNAGVAAGTFTGTVGCWIMYELLNPFTILPGFTP